MSHNNKSGERGTAFESRVVRFMRVALDDERIERRAKHGSKDMGDLYRIYAHGFEGIAECKNYASISPKQLDEFKRQTVTERDNADADFSLLIINRKGYRTGASLVYVTLRDLSRITPLVDVCAYDGEADEKWVCMTLDECCLLMIGE